MKIYPNLNIIVAVGRNLEIGCKNQLLCHLPNDLKYFKSQTIDSVVVMGENTYFSLPIKPLPKRKNIVLSARQEADFEDCITLHSIEEVLKAIENEKKVFIMGGASVYKQFLPYVSMLYVTKIDADFPQADVFFPNIDSLIWREIQSISHPADAQHPYAYQFCVFERVV
ncbi:MAG: dihydrofolate reductase [Bacteroidales bacterium]|jgi:dihydrofolate reductase|nr:dihydrofolate reductase [Bacteroidales bacterium]